MFDERKTLEKIKANIALSNFVEEINSKENNKVYAQKKFWRNYEIKKRLLGIICSIVILAGGSAYAYQRHLKLSSAFFNANEVEPRPVVEVPEDSELQFTSFNGWLVSNVFSTGDEHSAKPHGHNGIDIVADKGTTILSVSSGKVKEVGFAGQLGNCITITIDDTYEVVYAHLDTIYIHEGDEVFPGAELGTVGATGAVTGPCLHFELRENGVPIDPMEYLDLID